MFHILTEYTEYGGVRSLTYLSLCDSSSKRFFYILLLCKIFFKLELKISKKSCEIMSVNTAHANNGVLIHSGETYVYNLMNIIFSC